jgi:peptide/nickel transport system substrate-binding protein
MYKTKRGVGRIALYLGVIAAMCVSIVPAGARQASAQGTSRTINGHVVSARFLEVWSSQGSEQNNVYVNGLAITDRRAEISLTDGKTYDTQWFERARYEAHPENKAPYDVLLGLLGVTLTEGSGVVDPGTGKVRITADAAFVPVAKPADADGKTKVWFPETKHSVSGKILEYWNKYGGLQQFGFPLSEQFNEISATDGKTYAVQYFERNRFELHPEKAAPYEVELGLLGVQQYKQTPIAAADLPIAPPKGVTSKKDTMIAATGQEPGSLFLLEEGTVTAVRHCYFITFNDSLTYGDDKEVYYPILAWYVPTIENGGAFFVGTGGDRHLIVKYKLRRGVKWADGPEVTSNDVVFGYKFTLDDHNTDPTFYLKLSGVDNPDKYTVLYNFMSNNEVKAKFNAPGTDQVSYDWAKVFIATGKPVVDPAYNITNIVLPQHVLSKIDPNKVQDSTFARNPIGFGPWKVDHWTPQVEMLLVPNPNYSLTDKPLLNRILIKEGVALDSAYQQLKAGDIDMLHGEAVLVEPPNAADLRANGVTIDNVPSASWEHIDFYFGYAPFKEKAVREAFMRGINRQRIVDVVYKGTTKVENGVVPPLVKFALENPDYAKNYPELAAKYKLPQYPYDRAAANKMLDDAGWVKGSDGIRAKGGVKLSFEYGTTNNPTRIAVQTLVQDDLKQLGVDAVLKQYPAGQYFDPQGPINKGTCKICQFAYTQTSISDFSIWDESRVPTDDNPNLPNRQQYTTANGAVNAKKVTDANQLFNSDLDPKIQAESSAIAQVGVMTDIAVIPLFQRLNIEFYRATLVNKKTTNTSFSQSWNATQWYFK